MACTEACNNLATIMESVPFNAEPDQVGGTWKQVKGKPAGIKSLKRGASDVHMVKIILNKEPHRSDVFDRLDEAEKEYACLEKRKQDDHQQHEAEDRAKKQQKTLRAKRQTDHQKNMQVVKEDHQHGLTMKNKARRGSKGHGKGKGPRPKAALQETTSSTSQAAAGK